jgi:hypothetical protein
VGPVESTQIHSFDPGDLNVPGQPNYFLEGGVFWTGAAPIKSATSHPGKGDARFTLSDYPVFETFTSADAILRPESFDPVPATANLDVQWTGTGERMKVVNSDQGFACQYENATGTLTWSATNDDGYTFDTTNEPSDFNLTHAFTCHLRNGAFFHGGAKDE